MHILRERPVSTRRRPVLCLNDPILLVGDPNRHPPFPHLPYLLVLPPLAHEDKNTFHAG